MSESYESTLQEQIDRINDRLDQLVREKIAREAKEVREHGEKEFERIKRVLESFRWLRQTEDGWVLVKRDDNGDTVSLPSHMKVSLTSSAAGRDNITVLEGTWQGLKVSLTTGFLVTTDPQHGAVAATFGPRTGGPVVIGGVTYDRQIVLKFRTAAGEQTVGPHPAKTDPGNPTPAGTHVMQIPDFPHAANPAYGPLRTVWFRIGTTGDRYVHPGRVSAGCITCAPPNWSDIYNALAKGRKDLTTVGDVKVT